MALKKDWDEPFTYFHVVGLRLDLVKWPPTHQSRLLASMSITINIEDILSRVLVKSFGLRGGLLHSDLNLKGA